MKTRRAPRRLAQLAAALALSGVALGALGAGGPTYSWQDRPTGTDRQFRGVAAITDNVAWVSGTVGTVMRTVDSGRTWESVGPPGTDLLQFRDIEAWDRDRAVILSVGDAPDAFRIYVTSNGGADWDLAFQNDEPTAFYDCMTFFDQKHGLALSDPVDGRFRILGTDDGGHSWHVIDADMPPALPGEFAFAASGQCITDAGGQDAWFATGGAAEARVFRTRDGGHTWKVTGTPIPSGPSGGIFALAFRSPKAGLAVGGDFAVPTAAPDGLALSDDRGKSWQVAPEVPGEYRSGAAWVNDRDAIVVGPTGSDVSLDRGATWQRFDAGSLDTVDCTARGACWASGAHGRAARLQR